MQGPFGARARGRRPAINITSLIDVMFLLLIFFMVSSTFRAQLGIDVELPAARTAAQHERSEYEITVKHDGSYYFGADQVDPESLRERIRALMAEEPEALLVLQSDRGAAVEDFIRAMDIARDEGGTRLVLPTRPIDAASEEAER